MAATAGMAGPAFCRRRGWGRREWRGRDSRCGGREWAADATAWAYAYGGNGGAGGSEGDRGRTVARVVRPRLVPMGKPLVVLSLPKLTRSAGWAEQAMVQARRAGQGERRQPPPVPCLTQVVVVFPYPPRRPAARGGWFNGANGGQGADSAMTDAVSAEGDSPYSTFVQRSEAGDGGDVYSGGTGEMAEMPLPI